MNRILELTQHKAACLGEVDAILDKGQAENRAFTAEEETNLARLKAQMEADERSIRAIQEFTSLRATVEAPAPAIRPTAEVHISDNAENAPFERGFGEFLQCVRDVPTLGRIDPRLRKRAALGANETVGSDGGFLVGKDVAPDILDQLHNVGVLAKECDPVTISSNSNSVVMNGLDETSRANGSRAGGVQAYWTVEAGAMTASRPKFRQINMKLDKLTALFYATDEQLEDSANLGSRAQKYFSQEMAFKVDDAILSGTGAGMPQGVLNSGVLVSVAKEAGQAAATFVYENAVKMYSRCIASSRSKAKWYINQELEQQLPLMNLSVGTGGAPVYLPAGGASAAPLQRLFGLDIVPIEQCSALGTVGDIILADFGQYLLATKGGLQQAQSIHVAFLTNETAFRFVYRVDGQTLRQSPLTPFKGTATLSPFVALATRA